MVIIVPTCSDHRLQDALRDLGLASEVDVIWRQQDYRSILPWLQQLLSSLIKMDRHVSVIGGKVSEIESTLENFRTAKASRGHSPLRYVGQRTSVFWFQPCMKNRSMPGRRLPGMVMARRLILCLNAVRKGSQSVPDEYGQSAFLPPA